jgi:hypothetical protein
MDERYMVHSPESKDPPKGPFSALVLKAMLDDGSLSSTARACVVGDTQWLPLVDVLSGHETRPAIATASPPVRSGSPVGTKGAFAVRGGCVGFAIGFLLFWGGCANFRLDLQGGVVMAYALAACVVAMLGAILGALLGTSESNLR